MEARPRCPSQPLPSCGRWGWKGCAPAGPGVHRGLRKPLSSSASPNTPHLCPRNVLELIEFFEEEDRFYLVFEKMRGGTWGLVSSWVSMGGGLGHQGEPFRRAGARAGWGPRGV